MLRQQSARMQKETDCKPGGGNGIDIQFERGLADAGAAGDRR